MPLPDLTAGGGHRVTLWKDAAGNTLQVSVACLDASWEPHAEVTEHLGPFDDLDEVLAAATALAHSLGGANAHQLELWPA